MTMDNRPKDLSERMANLEARMVTLENGLSGLIGTLIVTFGLTLIQAQILGVLIKRQTISSEALNFAIHGLSNNPPHPATMRVHLFNLKRRLLLRGIDITLERKVKNESWMIKLGPIVKKRIVDLIRQDELERNAG